jgi:hypothetical protein
MQSKTIARPEEDDGYDYLGGKVKIALRVNPPSHPRLGLLMVTSRYVEEIGPFWGRMLGQLGRALTGGFIVRWDKPAPGVWGIPKAELETFGVDIAAAVHALPPVIATAYGEVGVRADVRIVEGS